MSERLGSDNFISIRIFLSHCHLGGAGQAAFDVELDVVGSGGEARAINIDTDGQVGALVIDLTHCRIYLLLALEGEGRSAVVGNQIALG